MSIPLRKILSIFSVAIFCRLHAHVLLKDLAEIARILIAAGGGDRIDLGIALAQHVSCMTQATFRQIGTEGGATARKEFVR